MQHTPVSGKVGNAILGMALFDAKASAIAPVIRKEKRLRSITVLLHEFEVYFRQQFFLFLAIQIFWLETPVGRKKKVNSQVTKTLTQLFPLISQCYCGKS
jgi:hypothetical protein